MGTLCPLYVVFEGETYCEYLADICPSAQTFWTGPCGLDAGDCNDPQFPPCQNIPNPHPKDENDSIVIPDLPYSVNGVLATSGLPNPQTTYSLKNGATLVEEFSIAIPAKAPQSRRITVNLCLVKIGPNTLIGLGYEMRHDPNVPLIQDVNWCGDCVCTVRLGGMFFKVLTCQGG